MKKYIYIVFYLFIVVLMGCKSNTKPINTEKIENKTQSDTIRIANDELEYEIMIVDGGFNSWLHTTAKPRGFHNQYYLESRNNRWVSEWNNRAQFTTNNTERDLFLTQIDYQSGINYGYEVNYLLYNYLVYFQLKNNIRLGGFTPRP